MSIEQKSEFTIDKLTAEFSTAVSGVAGSLERYGEMVATLNVINPKYKEVDVKTHYPEARVLAQVVAAIYAPLIHCFSATILKNVENGVLPPVVIAPPRDAIPIAVSISDLAERRGVDVLVLQPHVNRNVAGIANNQKLAEPKRDPLLSLYLDQISASINGKSSTGAVELETGIYGTTSRVMAQEFKSRGVSKYVPVKFYGLGPNLSFVHAVLSGGYWVAEEAVAQGLVSLDQEELLMILLDTMEELGMEKAYQSVEKLKMETENVIGPVLVPVSEADLEIHNATLCALRQTAHLYTGLSDARELLYRLDLIIGKSRQGFPFTLTAAIPSMDSKQDHFANIRSQQLFDIPNLIL